MRAGSGAGLGVIGWIGAALLWAASPAAAAPVAVPVAVPVEATLSVVIEGLAPVTLSGSGEVSVDDETGSVTVPAGLVSLDAPISVPVTSTTLISSVTATRIGHQTGSFEIGGVTSQAPDELCGAGSLACVNGGGLGGVMGLTGVINVFLLPGGVLTFPIDLADSLVGQGGQIATPAIVDAAPWTTGTGFVDLGTGAGTTIQGTQGEGSFTLVTPTFISAAGNVLPVFTVLSLTAVPEPGLGLLVGGGLAAVALARRGRGRA